MLLSPSLFSSSSLPPSSPPLSVSLSSPSAPSAPGSGTPSPLGGTLAHSPRGTVLQSAPVSVGSIPTSRARASVTVLLQTEDAEEGLAAVVAAPHAQRSDHRLLTGSSGVVNQQRAAPAPGGRVRSRVGLRATIPVPAARSRSVLGVPGLAALPVRASKSSTRASGSAERGDCFPS